MEDVVEVYHLPYDPLRPVVCFDETSKQLVQHAREPIASRPGVPARIDDEYKRCGTANIFLAIEPLAGVVLIEATEHRTAVDCAAFLRYLADDVYPTAIKILLVFDNLNIHTPACFYQAYPPHAPPPLPPHSHLHPP